VLRALAPDAWIGIGSDRSESFDRAFGLAQSVGRPIDLVILDDGFQHFALDRDVDLILMTDRSSSEVVFRDSWKSISQASLLIFGSGGSWPHPERLPDIRVERSLIWIQELPRPEASVGLVTSVASPERVVRALKDQEIQVVRHWSERDHATFTSAWVSQVIQEAKAHGIPVVMTLKDWVKWREVADPTFAVGVIETQWTVTEGISLWEGLWR
jgi:tetraacyldisaccharide-1-P 4'-kinase